MTAHHRVEDIVKGVLKEQFSDVTFESIEVNRDVDEDGDPILRIRIVFDGRTEPLDPRRTSGLVRHMRPRMADQGIEDFPILSFIAKSDLRDTRPETV